MNKDNFNVPAEIITNEISFEEFITRGQELREKADNLQWEFGDLAVEFTAKVGNKFLPDLARGIGVQVSTLRRYRLVSEVFPFKIREAYRLLSWSHFRTVAAHEDRHLLLQRAHDENWSVEKTAVMAKPKQQDVIDDGLHVPPKPDVSFDTEIRLWYIANPKEDARHIRSNIKK
jgi:hypothetical protein